MSPISCVRERNRLGNFDGCRFLVARLRSGVSGHGAADGAAAHLHEVEGDFGERLVRTILSPGAPRNWVARQMWCYSSHCCPTGQCGSVSAQASDAGVSWRGTVFVGSGSGRHRTQVLQDDGVSLTQLDRSESDAPLVRSGRFAMLSSTSDDEAWPSDVRVNVRMAESQFIPMLSRGVLEVAPHSV